MPFLASLLPNCFRVEGLVQVRTSLEHPAQDKVLGKGLPLRPPGTIPSISQYVANSLLHNCSPVAGYLLAEFCSQPHLPPPPLLLSAFLPTPFCFSCPIGLHNCDCPLGAVTQLTNPTFCKGASLSPEFSCNSTPTELPSP